MIPSRKIPVVPAFMLGLAVSLASTTSCTQASNTEPTRMQTIAWPREYAGSGDTVAVYDPQVDSWKDYKKLSARSAVAAKPKGSTETVYGVLEYTVETEIDAERREVLFRDRKFTAVRFTGLEPSKASQAEEIVRRLVKSSQNVILPLDFVLAQVEMDAKSAPSVPVNLDPPPIFTAEASAILVMFFGKPELKPITGTDLQFCINTNWDVLLHPGTSQYYLLNGEGWLTTKNLKDGPWSLATSLPASISGLPKDENWAEVRKHVPGKKIPVPIVFYAERPSELILLEGPAKYADIPGTDLRYVTNTTSHLFMHKKEANHYFLTSGRWFRAKSLQGPWGAATKDLPPDFAKIPPESPKGSVLASVPGTPEAGDAVLLAEVPHKANVNPKAVSVKPTYDGEPTFTLIEGTSVYYAVNSPFSVFRVNEKYYCCQDAVWFCATGALGPWTVCTSVPPEIYKIPSSHPKHNVTYVTIYDSTPDVVVVGYTAGYTGVYVSSGVVVYGAAYPIYYTPYYHYHYYPHYYGYGCAMHYNYAYGTYYRSAHVYGPYGGAGYGTAYNPYTGTYARGGYAYGPYGERHAAQSYNPYTGTYKARAGGSTPYSSWERGVVSQGGEWARGGYYSDSRGTVGGVQTSQGGAAVGVRTDDGGAAVARTKNGDIYAAKDGTVYKKNDDGSWSSNQGGQWAPTEPRSAGGSAQTREATPGSTPSTREAAGTPSQTKQSGASQAKPSGTSSQTKPTGKEQPSAGSYAGQGADGSPSNRVEMEKQSQNRSRGWENSQRSGGGSSGRPSGSSGGGGGRRR